MPDKRYRDILIGVLLVLVLAVYPLLTLVETSGAPSEESKPADTSVVTENPLAVFTTEKAPELPNNKPEYLEESSGYRYAVKDGKATILSYTGEGFGSITVPAELDGIPVDTVSANAFHNLDNLKEVTFSEGIRDIEKNFFMCQYLEKVNLPESLRYIAPDSFEHCTRLYEINSAGGKYKTIDGALFSADGETLIKAPAGLLHDKYGNERVYTVPENVKTIGTYSLGDIYSYKVVLPENLETIESYAFKGSWYDVHLPGNVERVGYEIFGDKINNKFVSAVFPKDKFPSLDIYGDEIFFGVTDETPAEHAIRLARCYDKEGYLMDFDLDGVPELVQLEWGEGDDYIYIYSLLGDYPENIMENGNDWGLPIIASTDRNGMRLYYDSESDRYFYAMYVYGFKLVVLVPSDGKLIYKTVGSQQLISGSKLNQEENYYVIIKNQQIAGRHFGESEEPLCIKGDPLEAFEYCNNIFIDEAEKYLSQFELIKTIDTNEFYPGPRIGNRNPKECFDEMAEELRKDLKYVEYNRSPLEEKEQPTIIINGNEYALNSYGVSVYVTLENPKIDFDALARMPNLTSVYIYNRDGDILPVDLSGLSKLPNITSIGCHGIFFNPEYLIGLENLQELDMSYYDMDIGFISDLKKLRIIELQPGEAHDDVAYFEPLCSLPELSVIYRNGWDFNTTYEQYNYLLEKCPDLIYSYYKR